MSIIFPPNSDLMIGGLRTQSGHYDGLTARFNFTNHADRPTLPSNPPTWSMFLAATSYAPGSYPDVVNPVMSLQFNSELNPVYPFWSENNEGRYVVDGPTQYGMYEIHSNYKGIPGVGANGVALADPSKRVSYRPRQFLMDLGSHNGILNRVVSISNSFAYAVVNAAGDVTTDDQIIVETGPTPANGVNPGKLTVRGVGTFRKNGSMLSLENQTTAATRIRHLFTVETNGVLGATADKVTVRTAIFNPATDSRISDVPLYMHHRSMFIGRDQVPTASALSGFFIRGNQAYLGMRVPLGASSSQKYIQFVEAAGSDPTEPANATPYSPQVLAMRMAIGSGGAYTDGGINTDIHDPSLFAGGMGVLALRNVIRNHLGVGPSGSFTIAPQTGTNPVGGFVHWAWGGEPHWKTSSGAVIKLSQRSSLTDADGTLSDATTKLNAVLSHLRTLGLVAV
jgi:hypothetical protein